ncbi:MAG: formylglycine-generating enzyme family protein [Nitrospinales bacterium]
MAPSPNRQKLFRYHRGILFFLMIFFLSSCSDFEGTHPGMVKIPGGEYMAGADLGEGLQECKKYHDLCEQNMFAHEEPKHSVTVKDFYIDIYEVTQKNFKTVMGVNPAKRKAENRPAIQMTWNDAKIYCAKVGKRLPTEAEWEKAAKGGTSTKYHWGDEFDGAYAWIQKNSEFKPHPVGQRRPNAYGLYDMAGNVAEWTSDWSDDSQKFIVTRGGAWNDYPHAARPASRNKSKPDSASTFIGFRCAS